MSTPRATIKTYFQTGDFPTQQEFYELLDSYVHADDVLSAGLTTEQVQDIVGAMVNDTITGLTIAYNDPTGKIDFSITAGYIIPTTTEQTNWNSAYTWTNAATVNVQAIGDIRYLKLSGAQTMTGQFNLSADGSTAMQPVTYQQLVAWQVGLWDDRGTFDASVNAYPTTGGSGTAGAILKGDIWTISVAGTLPTGQVVNVSDTVRAKIDTPGNTQANWALMEGNLGYTPLSNVATSAYIVLGNNANVATPMAITGDITFSNTGVTAIGAGKVTDAMHASSYIYANGSRALTADWAAGAFNISARNMTVNGTGGAGFMELQTQASAVAAGTAADSVRVFSNAGLFSWVRSTGSDTFVRSFSSTNSANRVYSLIDASMTFARIDAAQTFAGVQTFTGQILNSFTSVTATPATKYTGAWFAGANSAHLLLEQGATAFNGSTSGTGIGVNALTAFAGNLMDLQQNGSSKFKVTKDGNTTANNISLGAILGTATTSTLEGSGSSSRWQFKCSQGVSGGGNYEFTITGGGVFTSTNAVTQATIYINHGVTTTATNTATVYNNIRCQSVINISGTGNTGGFTFIDYDPTITAFTSGNHYGILIRPATAKNGFGTAVPTAIMHLGAGSATLAPFKLTSGALLSTPEAGAIGFLTDDYYYTQTTGTTRHVFAHTPIQTTVSRAKNTTYTNSSTTRSILVTATFRCAVSLGSGVATFQAKSDSSTPPTTVVSGIVGIQLGLIGEDNTFSVTFVVAAGANYRVDTVETNGTVTLGNWFETSF